MQGTRPPRCAAALGILFSLTCLAACEREQREFRSQPAPETGPAFTPVGTLHAGNGAPPAPDPRARHYERNAYHINQGERLFHWFNCNGCHADGGGGIGPALIDAKWRYGGSMDEIFATIRDGRPNGMPAFGGKVPDQQIWQLAAYVRALSGNVPKDAAPSRHESMTSTPPLSMLPRRPPQDSAPEKP